MIFHKTPYYEEVIRYTEMAKWLQRECNLGTRPYTHLPWDDDLLKNVYLYDVVERRYAGFSQLTLDLWHDLTTHPYRHKMPPWRKYIVNGIDTRSWDLMTWLVVFFINRLTGSGINYAQNPSGYHNSSLLHLQNCKNYEEVLERFINIKTVKYTSKGYQFPRFPKPPEGYVRGGDYFIVEMLPEIVYKLIKFLQGDKKTFRQASEFLKTLNADAGLHNFAFAYSAALADIADFFPSLINRESLFLYGSNARQCMDYMGIKVRGHSKLDFYDRVTQNICQETNTLPYNMEDIFCDAIRWVENYIRIGGNYDHLDLDKVWSSCRISDHPYGRQKMMIRLGLIDTFNGQPHPTGNKIIQSHGWSEEHYKDMCATYKQQHVAI